MHAKLINGYPQYAPRIMRVGDEWVYNPTPAMLEADGYMPVIETPAPETDETHYAVPHWAVEDGEIVQSWTVEEIPITEEEALTRYANTLTGANDPDLISAAETLIEQRIKEES